MTGDKPEEGLTGGSQETNPPAGVPQQAVAVQGISTEPLTSALSEEVPATRYDIRVLHALRRIIRAVDLHSRKLWDEHKITGPQLVCLLAVEEFEPVTGSVIAHHVHLSPSTVVGILDRLEAQGLIRRERDLKDRRLVQVSLTEHGVTLVASAPSPLQDTLAEAMNELPEAELATITESLDRIVEMMQARHIDAAPILQARPIDPTAGVSKAVEPPGGGEPGP